MELTDNLRIELLNELIKIFPGKADKIIKKAESICSKDLNFNSLNESEKVDKVLKVIFENEKLLGKETYLFLEVNNYLKTISLDSLSKEFLEDYIKISKNPFFNSSSISNKVNKDNENELINLKNQISQTMDKFSEVYSILSNYLQNHYKNLKKLDSIEKSKEVEMLKSGLNKSLEKFLLFENKFSETFNKLCEKLKIVEKELNSLNQDKQKQLILDKITETKDQLEKVFTEQDEIFLEIDSLQINSSESIIKLSDFLNKISKYMVSLPIIDNIIYSIEKLNLDPEYKSKLETMKINFYNNLSVFFSKITFIIKNTPEISNNSKIILNKFLDQSKEKLSPETYTSIQSLINTVVK